MLRTPCILLYLRDLTNKNFIKYDSLLMHKMIVIGVDIGATNIRVAPVNISNGELIEEPKIADLYSAQSREIIRQLRKEGHTQNNHLLPATEAEKLYSDSINNILSIIDQVVKRHPDISGIGIGCPGALDPSTGIVGCDENALPPNLWGWNNVNLVQIIQQKFHVDTKINGDVRVQAWGEHQHGSAKGIDTFLEVAPGTGFGCGIVENHKLKDGIYHCAGEIWKLEVYRPELGRHAELHVPHIFDFYGSIEGVTRILIENKVADYMDKGYNFKDANYK